MVTALWERGSLPLWERNSIMSVAEPSQGCSVMWSTASLMSQYIDRNDLLFDLNDFPVGCMGGQGSPTVAEK